jgi:hypothetical protein
MSLTKNIITDDDIINDGDTHTSNNSIQLFNNNFDEYDMDIDMNRSESSDKKKNKFQKIDKGHHMLSFVNGKGISRKVEAYSVLNLNGSYIRDAITGVTYNLKVGSIQSDQFFKIKDCVHKDVPMDHIFFYDSPEQYERHTKTELTDKIKSKWRDIYVSKMVENNMVG